METMLPLLSGGLRTLLRNVSKNHSCEIAESVLKADALIESTRKICNMYVDENELDKELYYNITDSIINSIITDHCRMISYRTDEFALSYLPKGKECEYNSNGNWARTNRETAKPARLIQKLLVKSFKCKEFEDFNNWVKAEIMDAGTFVIVENSDIVKYYNEETYYSQSGTLYNSCMRYPRCSKYLEIYEDCAKMLVMLKDGKVKGRAIVWEVDGKTLMDRIYTTDDFLVESFLNYAQDNKWYHRRNNCLLYDGDYQEWVGPEDNYKESFNLDLTIVLPKEYEYMPYVDSFRYYDSNTNRIFTNPDRGNFNLSDTYGEYADHSGDSEEEAVYYRCHHCGEEYEGTSNEVPEGLVWSDWYEKYFCEDCAQWNEYCHDYFECTDTITTVNTDIDETEEIPDTYLIDNGNFVLINGEWYLKSHPYIYFNSETGTYFYKEGEDE